MSDTSSRVLMPECPPDYVGGAARDPSQPTTSVGCATQSQSSEAHAYGCVSSHNENCCKSQVTPRLPQCESMDYVVPHDNLHSATQSESLTTSDSTTPCSVYDPMAIDQVSDASQVTPRHPPNDQVLPTTTEATDSTDLYTNGSFMVARTGSDAEADSPNGTDSHAPPAAAARPVALRDSGTGRQP